MDEEIEMEVPGKVQNTTPVAPPVEKKPVEIRPTPVIDHSRFPYPARLKHQKYTREYRHFLDMFRQLKINLPFIEALQHMSKYAKFLNDLLKRKDRLGEMSLIPLMRDCLAVVLNHIPEKLSDPVKVDKFVFTVDFLVLDMEADEKVPIILGRLFLHTEKALIDVYDGKITLRVGDKNVAYDVARSMRHPSDQDDFSGADLVGSDGLVDYDDLGEDESCENDLVSDELAGISGLPEMIEVNEISCESEAGSVEKPAPLELKVLPSHLEYAYLDEGSNLPVIVSSKLTKEEKSKLIDVLNPAYCLYRILIEDEYKPVVQQRRLNPNMQEVVKKEVLKLMDTGMINPISDSPWVSPTQVVLKKGDVETKLMLNWEKCHFMVTKGIVLGHNISRDGIDVDRAKIDTISRLPPSTNVKAIRSFLGHAGFYRRFIKDFSKITRPMTRLLEKDVPFVFDDECVKAFTFLKEKLKKYAKPSLIGWILLLFKFDIEIKDKKGAENVAADHLSHLEDQRREELHEEENGDTFPHESINFVTAEKQGMPWFTGCANYLAKNIVLEGMTTRQKRKFFQDVNRCATKEEGWDTLKHVHEGLTGGYHGAHATTQKVFDSGFYWPTVVKDAVEFVKLCDACQRTGKLRSKWTGPYLVKEVFPYGVVELENPDNGTSWKDAGEGLSHGATKRRRGPAPCPQDDEPEVEVVVGRTTKRVINYKEGADR
ncbi:uncharacterized protein LOC143631118 [Bidens hawaiensis]|uniref:uncharacterized protein LOC143631118 n=1 Tax=Bidens hawaiensis TaxID=980011 RepID=UPI00404B4A9C